MMGDTFKAVLIPTWDFIPMYLQGRDGGEGGETAQQAFARFFDGRLPKPGDIVAYVCYEASDTEAKSSSGK